MENSDNCNIIDSIDDIKRSKEIKKIKSLIRPKVTKRSRCNYKKRKSVNKKSAKFEKKKKHNSDFSTIPFDHMYKFIPNKVIAKAVLNYIKFSMKRYKKKSCHLN